MSSDISSHSHPFSPCRCSHYQGRHQWLASERRQRSSPGRWTSSSMWCWRPGSWWESPLQTWTESPNRTNQGFVEHRVCSKKELWISRLKNFFKKLFYFLVGHLLPHLSPTSVFRGSLNLHPPSLHSSLILLRTLVMVVLKSSLVEFPEIFPRCSLTASVFRTSKWARNC